MKERSRYIYVCKQVGERLGIIANVPLNVENNECSFNERKYSLQLAIYSQGYIIIDEPVWVAYQDNIIRYVALSKKTVQLWADNQKKWYPESKIEVKYIP